MRILKTELSPTSYGLKRMEQDFGLTSTAATLVAQAGIDLKSQKFVAKVSRSPLFFLH